MGGMRRIGAAAVALALVGGLSACGDDGGSSEDAADETTTTEDSGDETTTTEDSGDDSGSDSGGGGVAFENLEECSAFASAYASLGLVFLGGAFGLEGEDFDAEQILSDMDNIADEAPDEVQDAIDDVVSTYQEVFDNLQEAGIELNDAFDFANPEFASAIEPLNEEDFNDANTVVSDYLTELCGG